MSTHQQSKFCRAKKSITEESSRPGTCRSNVGCAAMDEPCTNRMVPAVCFGSPAHFSNMKSFAPSLVVQCSSPLIAAAGFVISFIVHLCSFPGCDAARSGAPPIRDRRRLGVCNDPRRSAPPLHAALRPEGILVYLLLAIDFLRFRSDGRGLRHQARGLRPARGHL